MLVKNAANAHLILNVVCIFVEAQGCDVEKRQNFTKLLLLTLQA
jgi:hypothetical protein